MNCKNIQARILAGAVPPDAERHLAECAECRGFARAKRLALGAVPDASPSAALDERIRGLARERLAARTPRRRTGWRLLTPEVKLALAASFSTLLAVGALMMAPYEGGRSPADEALLAWDADPVAAHGISEAGDEAAGPVYVGDEDLRDAELDRIERCMERMTTSR